MRNREINVVIGTSKEQAAFVSVVLRSLFENNKGEYIRVFLYHDEDITDEMLPLQVLCEETGNVLQPIRIEGDRKNKVMIKNMPWWHSAIWYRYFCIEDLYDECDRVLLLGTDTLVLGSLRSFMDTDLEGACFMGVTDMGAFYGEANHQQCEKYGISPEDYVNTDVLVIDIKKAHDLASAEQMVRQYEEYSLWALDQDVINVCYREHLFVNHNMSYNYMPSVEQQVDGNGALKEYTVQNAVIMHYAVNKPWKDYDEEQEHKLWFHYAKKCPNYVDILERSIYMTGDNVAFYKQKKEKMLLLFDALDRLFWIF